MKVHLDDSVVAELPILVSVRLDPARTSERVSEKVRGERERG